MLHPMLCGLMVSDRVASRKIHWVTLTDSPKQCEALFQFLTSPPCQAVHVRCMDGFLEDFGKVGCTIYVKDGVKVIDLVEMAEAHLKDEPHARHLPRYEGDFQRIDVNWDMDD